MRAVFDGLAGLGAVKQVAILSSLSNGWGASTAPLIGETMLRRDANVMWWYPVALRLLRSLFCFRSAFICWV